MRTAGLHHVTAICGDAQRNFDFYAGVLGLRLVKRTVNFDDPGSYHLYYGDAAGQPGTILTFFAWPGASPGWAGDGETLAVALAVERGSLGFWRERLKTLGIPAREAQRRGEALLAISDPDGMSVELVECTDTRPGWTNESASPLGVVPPEYAIRGLHSVTLRSAHFERTSKLLTALMDAQIIGEEAEPGGSELARFALGNGVPGALCDVLPASEMRRGQLGAGTIHHIAWRAADDDQQQRWNELLLAQGLNVSPVLDRSYFYSIYFREPGGVLFEIATDPPGFTADEPIATLGRRLQLPTWLEAQRGQIEARLPPLNIG